MISTDGMLPSCIQTASELSPRQLYSLSLVAERKSRREEGVEANVATLTEPETAGRFLDGPEQGP